MWHGSWAGAQQDEARARWRDGSEEIWPPQRAPGHSHCHCHGNGQHQPSCLLPARPGLLQPQPILARPGTSIVCQGIQAYRTSTSGTDLHFVRSTITTARGWWRVNKVTRRRNVDEAKSGPSWAWPRLVRSARLPGCQVARLQRRRCDRRCASILRASLVDLRPRQANNHTHRRPRIT